MAGNPKNTAWEKTQADARKASKSNMALAKKMDDGHRARQNWDATKAGSRKGGNKAQ